MAAWSARKTQVTVGAFAILILAGLGAAAAFGAMGGDPGSRPGLMASLPDHRKLNFRCEGKGSPTVLLESGFGANANAWYKVMPLVAPVTRVCAYDRAGAGFSDPGPSPRDGAAIARDLDAGLKAAKIDGPFVVVGHSAGGLYARLFAARRRQDVVGLVFVDSSVEHQTERVNTLAGQNVGGIEGLLRKPTECLRVTSQPKASPDDPAVAACVGKTEDAHQRQIELQPWFWRTQISELENLFTTTSDEVDRIGALLRDVPAVVLTA
ncbi:MAG: alpha/beta hydrolase, partial [Proteobacteria bacterium]|nr:alpha/beta hydrolase [Pseudomonadota bacterium]